MSPHLDSSFIGASEFMLFGVRVSSNNPGVSKPVAAAAGAAVGNISTGVPARNKSSLRKRGIQWTEDEHKLFLEGLQKVGNGDWKAISRYFVKTRTRSQVASHAQKYFLRKSNNNPRRRSSVFDITIESVAAMQTEEGNGDDQARPAANLSNLSSDPEGSSLYQISGSNNGDGMIILN